MGYFEYVCQLCGVSFAICRLRRADEPETAAWAYFGQGYVENDGYVLDEECQESGCELRERESILGREGVAHEHIAGPGCASKAGYSGYRLSLEEMKGCRAIQCLAAKDKKWAPEPDDEDFELESGFFLTGFGDGSPDETPLDDIKPVRHGVQSIMVSNLIYLPHDDAIPFHPTCFEIFKKVSRRQFGFVDVEGLWYWREHGCDYESFFKEFPRAFEVREGSQQWWEHHPGCEYLATNPVDIPGLQMIVKSGSKIYHDHEAHFGSDRDEKSDHFDCFQKLSVELKSMVLDYLGSRDIANLRLATPEFRTLPNLLFRRLVLEELPWMWEAEALPIGRTDWNQFYRKSRNQWLNFKGLQNRKRIWKDVEEVVRRIGQLKGKGMIGAQGND